MNTYVALLRGINVGGKHSLPMRGLVNILESLGFEEVRTYIQSGNVVFRSRKRNVAELERKIRDAIAKEHGFTPEVMVLSSDQLDDAIRSNPFREADEEPAFLHLYFLAAQPERPDRERMNMIRSERERFEIVGRVFYLHAPEGIGRSKLAAAAERLLGVAATARNWRTVTKLRAMAIER